MEATLVGTLLSGFEDWLNKTEEAEIKQEEPYGGREIKNLTVEGLFTQMGLVIQCIQTDPSAWREI